jgi:hypothetical protein
MYVKKKSLCKARCKWISRWCRKLKKSKTDRVNEQLVKMMEEERLAEKMDDITPDIDC